MSNLTLENLGRALRPVNVGSTTSRPSPHDGGGEGASLTAAPSPPLEWWQVIEEATVRQLSRLREKGKV